MLAVDLVAGDPAGRHPGVQCRLSIRRPAPAWWRTRPRRDAGRGAPVAVLGPGPGQVQLPVDEGPPGRGGVGQEHPDLAVLDPPGGAGVLPGHPDRLGALLQEPGLVDHQHRIVVAEVLHDVVAQVVADRVGVPVGVVEQPLHRIRGGVPGLLGQRPAVLPLGRRQQAPHIRPARARGSDRANRGPIRSSTSSRPTAQSSTSATVTSSATPTDREGPHRVNRADTPRPIQVGAAVVLGAGDPLLLAVGEDLPLPDRQPLLHLVDELGARGERLAAVRRR